MRQETDASTLPDITPEFYLEDAVFATGLGPEALCLGSGLIAERSARKSSRKGSRKTAHVVKEDPFELEGMINVDAFPTTKADLLRHGLIEVHGSSMTCMLCGYESGPKGLTRIQRHLAHNHSIGPGYPCPVCDYEAKTKDDCQKHGKLKHRLSFSYLGSSDNMPSKVRRLK